MANTQGCGEPQSTLAPAPAPIAAKRLGGKALAAILALQAAALSIATYPAVAGFSSSVPQNPDAWQHLWIMHWYRTCLVEGRSWFLCPELQYPVGAPIGSFSPLHFQALLFLPLSFVLNNDALCYNIVWTTGLLLTGLGTTLLAWQLLRDRLCAGFAGLLAMLSAPVMIHASAHLELIYVGWFPIFLVCWMRFVDAPSPRRLVASAASYVLVSMCAAYYMIFAIFPAILYVVWAGRREGTRGSGAWIWMRSRAPWFASMVGLTLPCLLVLFSGHIWTALHGFGLERSRPEFNQYATPLWSYFVPSPRHLLAGFLPVQPYAALGASAAERTAYLGVVTGLLALYAAVRRVSFPKAGYVWLCFGLLVVLSMGATCTVFGHEVSLPSSWLWDVFPPFRMTRVPSRFCLFAAVPAAVLASAGLKDLLGRLNSGGVRIAVFALIAALTVADLAMVGFPKSVLPELPRAYAFVKQRDPRAHVLEIPYTPAGGSFLYGETTYWQALHRLTTSAGYSGHDNAVQEERMGHDCPFRLDRIAQPDYLADPAHFAVALRSEADFREYSWLYLKAHEFDYMILQRDVCKVPELKPGLERLQAVLADCVVYRDDRSIVFDRTRLRPPAHPLTLSILGFGGSTVWRDRPNRIVPRISRIALYQPEPDGELTLALDAAAIRRPRQIRLLAGSRELARWRLEPGGYQSLGSPVFRLTAGLHELTLAIDDEPGSREKRPQRLRVASVKIDPVPGGASEHPRAIATGNRAVDITR